LKSGVRPRFFFAWGLTPILLLTACAPLAPLPGGEFAFGVLGDTPYSQAEARKLDALIGRINEDRLAFVVHVGDIGTSARDQGCSDAWLEARKRQFARIRHPFILIPGDNEWSDCAHHGMDPLERLRQWRRLFCDERFERQAGEYCEHRRWETGGYVFVTLNVPGSNNNVSHPEHAARMRAVAAWLDESAALAEKRAGLVVLLHADPFVLNGGGYADLRARLAVLAQRRPGQVILVNGDTHVQRDDEPLPGMRRLEVWGSPFVAWLRASAAAGGLRVEGGW